MEKFYDILQSAKNEKDVENYYREYFNTRLKKLASKDPNITTIVSPYKTDGLLKYKNKNKKVDVNCLFEFKYDVDFSNKVERTRVLIQCLYYLKKFELGGEFFLPTTLFVGDRNECFYLHTNSLIKYLGYKLDWNIAPSEAGYKNNELLMEMVQDANLENIYVIDIDKNFNFSDTLKHINEISLKTKSKFRITSQNVHIILASFLRKVLNDKKLSVNDEVNLFIQTLVDRVNNYQHPNKPNILMTRGFGEVKINGSDYKSFINYFETELSPSEKEALTATQDRLIQDETRRKQGEFFTPTIWVDEAHKMISEQFGENWKEEYVVWDCAWGTGNLTRDYRFKELYCSTLNASDIETANQAGYNPEAVKFQYDFLNDGIIDGKIDVLNDIKLPDGLRKAILDGKKIIFFINPPYGTSSDLTNIGSCITKHKKDIANNKLNYIMLKDGYGKSSSQLYTQFLYKITKLQEINKNIKISLFSPPLFMSGGSYKSFRSFFLKKFSFQTGFLMNSNEFDGTSNWGLSFTIWESGENEKPFSLILKTTDEIGIKDMANKDIYNLDSSKSLSYWIREEIKNRKDLVLLPHQSSALTISNKTNQKIARNSLGSLCNLSNNCEKNSIGIFIVSSIATNGNAKIALSILPENFKKMCVTFTARKSIKSNWINQKDEYMAPDENNPLWHQFQNDSIVYSLFNTSSNQSSMRQVEYKDKLWDIKNEFFWMSKGEMLELAEEYKFDELYKDAKLSPERYVHELLKTTNLSPDAKELLELSKELVRKSFEWRKILHTTNPEYHLHTWDAGWYQIKKILNEHFKEDLAIFTKKYKAFEDRLRPQVYELGFLKKDDIEYDEDYQNEIDDNA
jgi:hypothetical protein